MHRRGGQFGCCSKVWLLFLVKVPRWVGAEFAFVRDVQVKMTLLRGFVACGELESALELFAGFKEASIELPREFGDFVRALRGEEVQERADQEAQAMADEEQALKGSCETASLCGEEHHEHRGKWGGGGKGDVEMEDAGVEEGRVTLKVYEVEADVQRTERLAEEAC